MTALALSACTDRETSSVHDDIDTSTVRGLVVEVEEKSVLELRSLTVRDASGRQWSFAATDFTGLTPSHLKQHMLLGEPVSVTFHTEDHGLVIDEIAD